MFAQGIGRKEVHHNYTEFKFRFTYRYATQPKNTLTY